MWQKAVGTYYLGPESVLLVLRSGEGGEYYCTPAKGATARIKVGADKGHWKEVVAVLLHEAMELALDKLSVKYDRSLKHSGDSASCVFFLRHDEFSEACARVADMLTDCLPDLSKAWATYNQRKRKQR